MDSENKNEIKFPCDWEYRVFCVAAKADSVMCGIRDIALAENFEMCIEPGEVSKSGTYRTVRVTARVESRDNASFLGELISKIDGVKFML